MNLLINILTKLGLLVAKYDLRSRNLGDLVGQGNQHADFAFAYDAPEGSRAFVSTIKLRQAGIGPEPMVAASA
jgi:hypothetical protein